MQLLSRSSAVITTLALAGLLGACADTSQGYRPNTGYGPNGAYNTDSAPSGAYAQRARVVDIEYGGGSGGIAGTGISTGAVIGGIVGGLVGNQVGGGTGRTLATLAGVAGGAMAGDRIEKSRNPGGNAPYRVTVQLPDGSTRDYDYSSDPQLRVGDYVRVENDQLYR